MADRIDWQREDEARYWRHKENAARAEYGDGWITAEDEERWAMEDKLTVKVTPEMTAALRDMVDDALANVADEDIAGMTMEEMRRECHDYAIALGTGGASLEELGVEVVAS